jgi:hypothetical protein
MLLQPLTFVRAAAAAAAAAAAVIEPLVEDIVG